MELYLNGKQIVSSSVTLADLIHESGFEADSLIAELNRKVVSQDNWAATTVKDGDHIELLNFVGGG